MNNCTGTLQKLTMAAEEQNPAIRAAFTTAIQCPKKKSYETHLAMLHHRVVFLATETKEDVQRIMQVFATVF